MRTLSQLKKEYYTDYDFKDDNYLLNEFIKSIEHELESAVIQSFKLNSEYQYSNLFSAKYLRIKDKITSYLQDKGFDVIICNEYHPKSNNEFVNDSYMFLRVEWS